MVRSFLVGHSYGGAVVTDLDDGGIDIKAIVYVAAFAPDKGETALDLIGRMPGSQLGAALATPVPLADGSHDLFVDPDKFVEPFAADLPKAEALLMARTQRPVNDKAFNEPATRVSWRDHPAFFVFGSRDRSIPPALQTFMAQRARARKTLLIPGASHLVMLSHPAAVTEIIEDAAKTQ